MKIFLRKIKKNTHNIFISLTQLFFFFVKNKVICNICEYKANKFDSNPWHLHVGCPKCKTGVRHRLLWHVLECHKTFNLNRLIKGKKVLHFAPEPVFVQKFKHLAKTYKTADLFAEGYHYDDIDFNIDISNMSNLSDASIDCLIACDVLEHVTNDIKAIKETYRILNKGGNAIFTVPQRDHLEKTYECLSITDPKEREKAFGQIDHLRIYGDDFENIMKNCGFKVTVVDRLYFDEDSVKKHVLFPPILSKKKNVTNYRKIFVGTK